jgi:putative hydrolase of the HAD superfamily
MDRADVDLVLLDAFGTLIGLEPPVAILSGSLAAAGYPFGEDAVAAALAQEIAHYRARMHTAGDPVGLAALRAECGAVLAGALGPGAPAPALATDLLVDALRFRPYPDAIALLDALDDVGIAVGVVSNWDCALAGHLERLGLASRFRIITASAAVGHAKPDPRIFRHALAEAGVPAERALHVGDSPEADYAGARAAGLHALLIDRAPGARAEGDVITDLVSVADRVTG